MYTGKSMSSSNVYSIEGESAITEITAEQKISELSTLEDRAWKIYESTLGFYKFVWDLVIKVTVFFYTGSGLLFSFYVAHEGNYKILLWLPIILGVSLRGIRGSAPGGGLEPAFRFQRGV